MKYPRAPSIPPHTVISADAALPALPRDPAISDDEAALVERHEADNRWMDVLKLLAKQADAVAAPNRAAVHLRIAAIYHDRLANQAEAIKSYERVLEHDASNQPAIDALRALYEKRRDWEKLLELEKGALDRTDPEKRADKAVEVARLAAARVGKPDVTTYWWQRVLDYQPDHRQAHAELAKSFERAERWLDLIAILEHQAEIAPGNDEQIEAWTRIAAIRADHLHDEQGARDAKQRVRELSPVGDAVIAPATRSKSPLPAIAIGLVVIAIVAVAIYVAS